MSEPTKVESYRDVNIHAWPKGQQAINLGFEFGIGFAGAIIGVVCLLIAIGAIWRVLFG